ncbi:NXPE family member 3-like [Glandiceps talaboti]
MFGSLIQNMEITITSRTRLYKSQQEINSEIATTPEPDVIQHLSNDSSLSHSLEPDHEVQNTQNHDELSRKNILFPYNVYTPYAMEWMGVVEELEWADKHIKYNLSSSFSIGEGSLGMTSVKMTEVYLHGNKHMYHEGDSIHAVIETFDENGRKRLKGGDMFEAVMENRELQKSTSGRIVDYLNGTYSVYFYAGWHGYAEIGVSLSFTRETLHFLNTVVRPFEQRLLWTNSFRKGNHEEEVTCSIMNEGIWSNKCEYRLPAALGKSVYLCDKPANMDCEDIVAVKTHITLLDDIANKFNTIANNSAYFESHGGIVGKSIGITIKEPSRYVNQPSLPPCGADMPIPVSDGFWSSYSQYNSLVCLSRQWSVTSVNTCLAGRKFVLFGDSTLGQIHDELKSRFRYDNVYHVFHGLKIGPNEMDFWDQHFAVNVLENIADNECDSTVVLMNLSFHFAAWTVRAYLERLMQLKYALVQFMSRCVDTPVLFKGTNPRENGYAAQSIHSANWIFFDMNRMARRVLGGLGVRFIDVWDMSLAHLSKQVVHMSDEVIEQEIYLMMSYICPNMVI